MPTPSLRLSLFLLALLPTTLVAQDETPPPRTPKIAEASDEGATAMSAFRIPEGMKVDLFAAEPGVANPVAIFVDVDGKVYVCESFRQEEGIEDNREHGHWLLDDLQAQTVEDRIAYIKKHLGDKAGEYTHQDDRIRVLSDTNGDGIADTSAVFADRFNAIADGTGAGVLPYRGDVFYTCIPHLWRLRDEDDDGKAELRDALHSGFGVRFAFRGHDMHGLVIGPDRRLYFSIGDRGYYVSPEVRDPRSGAVFRCELNGSNLEVIATGLRNPQELAFDKFGNLFTGDNNSDSGDRARWVYIVEGSDSGWRMEYQYLPDRGPFNREKLWHPFHDETPAYIVPPVDNLSDGPSGLAYYPGTGFSSDFDDCFLLCDFRGQSSNSGIRKISVRPKGAFFEIASNEQTFWHMLPTDVAFSPDGKIYFSDWVHGWVGEGKGRIYTISDPEHAKSAKQVAALLNGGISASEDDQLVELLIHPDQRVRQEAQFELSDRPAAESLLVDLLLSDAPTLQRVHALWALENAARIHGRHQWVNAELMTNLANVRDAELRAQFARACGELQANSDLDDVLIERLADRDARVRHFAAMSLGKRKCIDAADGVFEMLAANADRDPILRHAGIMALTWMNDQSVLEKAASHDSVSVRLASVVAMRRLGTAESWDHFFALRYRLDDPDDRVVLEAARAIYDVEANRGLLEFLARKTDRAAASPHLARRVLGANFALGEKKHAQRCVQIATNEHVDIEIRIQAIQLLEQWGDPPKLDPVLGFWWPLEDRDASVARDAIESSLPALLATEPEVSAKVMTAAAEMEIESIQPTLLDAFNAESNSDQVRVDALYGLRQLNYEELDLSIERGLSADSSLVRSASLDLLADRDVKRALGLLQKAATGNDLQQRQSAIRTLGRMSDEESGSLVESLLKEIRSISVDTRLDILDAAARRPEPQFKELLNAYWTATAEDGPYAKYEVALVGGDAARGREIFLTRTNVSCLRCHKVKNQGGEVGPDLSEIGKTKDRNYLLNSLTRPNLDIAEEFQTLVVLDLDGQMHTGVRRAEDDEKLVLITAEGNTVTVLQEDIDDVRRGESSMPADLIEKLSLADIRDLVEFLANQK